MKYLEMNYPKIKAWLYLKILGKVSMHEFLRTVEKEWKAGQQLEFLCNIAWVAYNGPGASFAMHHLLCEYFETGDSIKKGAVITRYYAKTAPENGKGLNFTANQIRSKFLADMQARPDRMISIRSKK